MTQRKKLIALFLVGLLFMGLGGGIAFVEFSSFHFVGEKQLEQEAMQTETFVRQIESENRPLIINYYHNDFHGNKKINIVADASLDDETIVFDVTYHPEVASIHINYCLLYTSVPWHHAKTNRTGANYQSDDFFKP